MTVSEMGGLVFDKTIFYQLVAGMGHIIWEVVPVR